MDAVYASHSSPLLVFFTPLILFFSRRRPSNIHDLPIQRPNLLQRGFIRILLRKIHIRALQPLRKHIHDPTENVLDLRVAVVNQSKYESEPFQARVDEGVEGGGDGDGDGERDEWGHFLEVARVHAHEDAVEEVALAGGLEPLLDLLTYVCRGG